MISLTGTFKNMGKEKIVIIDDDSKNLEMLDEFLSSRYTISIANKPKQGLNKVKKLHPDLVILDIEMPYMNGFDVCEEIRAEPGFQDMPIIFLTASAENSSIHEALRLGANDYLTKPFHLNELLKRIETRLGQTHTGTPLKVGNLTLDPGNYQVMIRGKGKVEKIQLTRIGKRVLHHLLKNTERILSRRKLMELVWKNSEMSDRAVDLQIHRLRKLLKAWDYEITSVYGTGYSITKKKKTRKSA